MKDQKNNRVRIATLSATAKPTIHFTNINSD